MHRWGPRLDWEHLQNWVPGVLGAAAVILLVVIARRIPRRRPIQGGLSYRRRNPRSWQPKVKRVLPQLLFDRMRLKHLLLRTRQRKLLCHRRALRSVPQVKLSSRRRCTITLWSKLRPSLRRRQLKALQSRNRKMPLPQARKATPSLDARSSRNVRRATLWSREKPSWVQAWPGLLAASRPPIRISIIRRL